MRLRDRPFAPYVEILLFDGLNASTIDALPAAVEEQVALTAHELGLPRRRRSGGCFERLPEGATLVELVARARVRQATAPASFPFTVTVSGPRVAISAPHGLMDGRMFIEFLLAVVGRAAGQPVAADPTPVVRHPYLAMLRSHLSRDLLQRRRTAPSAWVPGPALHAPSAADLAGLTAQLAAIRVEPCDLARLAATEARGTSVAMRIGSLALGALRRTYLAAEDLPVKIPVDLRRFAPRGRIPGNFVIVDDMTTLLAPDTSAKALGVRLSTEVRSKLPIASSALSVWSSISHAPLARVKRALRGPRSAGASISLSLVAAAADWPEAAWIPGADPLCATAVVGPEWPSATLALMLNLGDSVYLSIYDESGLFDLDRFPAAVEEELAAREQARFAGAA